jgi:hypothetical protein
MRKSQRLFLKVCLLSLLPMVVLCSNRIQVSSSKKPLFFYVNLAKVCVLCWHLLETLAVQLGKAHVDGPKPTSHFSPK